MKHLRFLTVFILTVLFLPSCTFDDANSGSAITVLPSEVEGDKSNNTRSTTHGKVCDDNKKCIDSCEEVYDPDGDDEDYGKVETCVELSYRVAIEFEDMLDILEEPYDSNLRNIEGKTFDAFLDISIAPWEEVTSDHDKDESKVVLAWVARESKIASAIVNASKNYEAEFDAYEGMINLFKNIGIGDTECEELCDGMMDSIVGSATSFLDIIEETNNASAQCIAKTILENEGCDFSSVGGDVTECNSVENATCS